MTTHDDLAKRLDSGDRRFGAIEQKLDALIVAVAEMKTDIAETREIVEAWSAAKTVGKFVKWSSGLLAGIAVLWAAIKVMAMGVIR